MKREIFVFGSLPFSSQIEQIQNPTNHTHFQSYPEQLLNTLPNFSWTTILKLSFGTYKKTTLQFRVEFLNL